MSGKSIAPGPTLLAWFRRSVASSGSDQVVLWINWIPGDIGWPLALVALHRGVRTFLERCLDPGFRRIVLLDGPAVLGWDTVREIEYDHVLRVLSGGIAAVAGDPPDGGAVAARAQMLFGAVCEAGMLLARADDPAAAFETVLQEAGRLLDTVGS